MAQRHANLSISGLDYIVMEKFSVRDVLFAWDVGNSANY
jgi:hypothetical protein